MSYWLFQIMYDAYPESWEGMINMGIAAQHYPLSRNWVNAKRNNNALRKLRSGDFIVASFTDHRFAGYGILKSDFYVGGPSLEIPHSRSGELMEFQERFNCDWTIIPFDSKRPFIRCDDIKKEGFNIDMLRGQCVKQIDENTFKALKQRLDDSGARRELSVPTNAATDFITSDYVSAFRRLQINPHQMQILLTHYYAPQRTLTATQMANAMGYDHFSAANIHYGMLGGMIGETLGWNPLPEYKIKVLVDFIEPSGPGKDWMWVMKPPVAEAIEQLGWNREQPAIPEEVVQTEPLYEGAIRKVSVNAYERSTTARNECLRHYGCKCAACGVTLSDIYGEIAQGHIHVHHLRPLSEVNSEYQIDPVADLRPVCPTCHSIIHLKIPPYSIEEVRAAMEQQKER